MANCKGSTKGGSGGKLGHSNMSHQDETEVIKESTKIHRRQEDLRYSKEGISEYTRKHLTSFWFPLSEKLGIGVTAYTENDAIEMAIECKNKYYPEQKLDKPIIGITVAELDKGHVVPNMGPINFLGVWFPNETL